MVAYCETTDLLLGQIPTPAGLDLSKIVQDATDEIDSRIGMLYATPVDLGSVEIPRPVKLLLKRLNVFIASGRLIMAVTSNTEDDRLHAYGLSLVNDALDALKEIAAGKLILDGVPPIEGTEPVVSVPLIFNEDPESSVEAFYNRIANPSYVYGFQISQAYGSSDSENGIIR